MAVAGTSRGTWVNVPRDMGGRRWSGRLLLVLPATITGLWFGVLMPIPGAGEATVISLVAAYFVVSLARAFRAIRRGDVAVVDPS